MLWVKGASPLPQNVFCVGGQGRAEGARLYPFSGSCFEPRNILETNETPGESDFLRNLMPLSGGHEFFIGLGEVSP